MNSFISTADQGVERRPAGSLVGRLRKALARIPWLRWMFPVWGHAARCRQVDI